MAADASLPRTPIEWYMFGMVLVVLNVFGLLVTGHTLPASVGMGLVSGMTLALLVLILVATWQALTE